MLENGQLSMGHARAILPLESDDNQNRLAKEIIKKGLSVRETERLVKATLESRIIKNTKVEQGTRTDDNRANIIAAESKLSRRLGTPVKIKFSNNGGQIEIKFSSSDELTRIYELLIREPLA
jgi:ParB family chromosome partitioning protein